MNDIADGLGSAIEGGLTACAVEPNAGVKDALDDKLAGRTGACLNCGTTLTGPHCHDCGQKADVHRSLKAIFHDIVHGVLHLDGKLWRTLPLLAWKPGELTRRYIDGERAKFVSPMAMFLFSVFMMFATFQIIGLSTPANLSEGASLNASLDEAQTQAAQDHAAAQAALNGLPAGSPERAAAEEALAEAKIQAGAIANADDIANGEVSPRDFNVTGLGPLGDGLIKKWNENPGLMLYKLQNNAYKFSWLLIPLSIPAVWVLLFWKRRFKAYDHAIFVTYSLGFMSLLFIVLSTLGAFGVHPAPLLLAGIFVPIVHIYRHLRWAYELSRRGAFWRTVALTTIILFVNVMAFLWLLLLLGAL